MMAIDRPDCALTPADFLLVVLAVAFFGAVAFAPVFLPVDPFVAFFEVARLAVALLAVAFLVGRFFGIGPP
jgi:hypothetical protein